MSATGLRDIFQDKTGSGFTGALKRGAVALGLAAAALFSPAANGDAAADTLKLHESHTQHSRELENLSHHFNQERSDVLLVTLDPDWFQLNAAANGSTVLDRPLMKHLLEIYTFRKSGIVLKDDAHSSSILNMMAIGLNNTYPARLISVENGHIQKMGKACFLMPATADQDQVSHIKEYLLGMRPRVHTGIAHLSLNRDIRPELHAIYNDYHEMGHCFDRWYAEESFDRQEQHSKISSVAATIHAHKGETFPEVMGGLLMARDGISFDIVPERRDVRLVGNAALGPLAFRFAPDASRPTDVVASQQAIPLRGGRNAGFVYAFYRALDATQKKIDELGDRIKVMTLDEIAELAHDITEQNALGVNEALGALFLWHNLYDTELLEDVSFVRLEARSGSDLDFNKAYEFAKEYRAEMNRALLRVLNFGPGSRDSGMDALAEIGFRLDTKDAGRLEPAFGVEDITPVHILRDRLLAEPVVKKDGSLSSLIKAYESFKDERRFLLETGTKKDRRAARSDLSVAPEALRLALREMQRAPVRAAKPSP